MHNKHTEHPRQICVCVSPFFFPLLPLVRVPGSKQGEHWRSGDCSLRGSLNLCPTLRSTLHPTLCPTLGPHLSTAESAVCDAGSVEVQDTYFSAQKHEAHESIEVCTPDVCVYVCVCVFSEQYF